MNAIATTFGSRIVVGCWIIFIAYWLVMSRGTKRTVERARGWPRFMLSAVAIVVVFGWSELARRGVTSAERLWPRGGAGTIVGEVLVVAGLALALWARTVLGRNWSAAVTYKENHELIRVGPYRTVRHPIYSAMLLMLLGTALVTASPGWFGALVAAFAVAVVKSRMEERLMIEHFPEEYSAYRARTKALIPFVW